MTTKIKTRPKSAKASSAVAFVAQPKGVAALNIKVQEVVCSSQKHTLLCNEIPAEDFKAFKSPFTGKASMKVAASGKKGILSAATLARLPVFAECVPCALVYRTQVANAAGLITAGAKCANCGSELTASEDEALDDGFEPAEDSMEAEDDSVTDEADLDGLGDDDTPEDDGSESEDDEAAEDDGDLPGVEDDSEEADVDPADVEPDAETESDDVDNNGEIDVEGDENVIAPAEEADGDDVDPEALDENADPEAVIPEDDDLSLEESSDDAEEDDMGNGSDGSSDDGDMDAGDGSDIDPDADPEDDDGAAFARFKAARALAKAKKIAKAVTKKVVKAEDEAVAPAEDDAEEDDDPDDFYDDDDYDDDNDGEGDSDFASVMASDEPEEPWDTHEDGNDEFESEGDQELEASARALSTVSAASKATARLKITPMSLTANLGGRALELVESDSPRLRRAGNAAAYLFVDHRPVARLTKNRATEAVQASFADIEVLTQQFMSTLKTNNYVMTPEIASAFGLTRFAVNVPAKAALAARYRASLAKAKANLAAAALATEESLMQSVSVAAMGIQKNFWGSTKAPNPLRDALVSSLSELGVRDAGVVVDSVFESASEDWLRAVFARAKDFSNTSLLTRNEVAAAVEEASYKAGKEIVSRNKFSAVVVANEEDLVGDLDDEEEDDGDDDMTFASQARHAPKASAIKSDIDTVVERFITRR